MRLNRETEIAIGILATCASAPKRRWSIDLVARAIGISNPYTAHVVAILVRGGYLVTKRGRGGGLALAQPPEVIGLGEVLLHTQPDFLPDQSNDCETPSVGGANFDMIVGSGASGFVRYMDRFSIADLASGPALNRIAPCLDCRHASPSHQPATRTDRSGEPPSALLGQVILASATREVETKTRKAALP